MRNIQQKAHDKLRGRPQRRRQSYKPEFCAKAKELCHNGATDSELAEAFNVSIRTIEAWRLAHKEFFDACELREYALLDRLNRKAYEKAMQGDVGMMKFLIDKLEKKAPAKESDLALLLRQIQGSRARPVYMNPETGESYRVGFGLGDDGKPTCPPALRSSSTA